MSQQWVTEPKAVSACGHSAEGKNGEKRRATLWSHHNLQSGFQRALKCEQGWHQFHCDPPRGQGKLSWSSEWSLHFLLREVRLSGTWLLLALQHLLWHSPCRTFPSHSASTLPSSLGNLRSLLSGCLLLKAFPWVQSVLKLSDMTWKITGVGTALGCSLMAWDGASTYLAMH